MRNDPSKEASQDNLLSPLPDVILPSQFFELAGAPAFSSEQRLMLAVLVDAINVLGKYGVSPNRRKRKSFNETSSWVFAEVVTSPLSFEHVCDALNVDARSLRMRLSALLSAHDGTLRKLRLKEGGRIQRVTVKRVRRRMRGAHQGHAGRT
jgi:hypothetical protein